MGRRKIGLRDLIGDIEEELERIEEKEIFQEEDFQEEDIQEEMINKGLTEEEIRAKWKKLKKEEDAYGLKGLTREILCWLPVIIPAIILIIIGLVIFLYSSLS